MPKALITGITGQDGSYLAELLLAKGYEVHGIIRRSSSFNTGRIDHIYQDRHASSANLFLHHGDLTDALSLSKIVNDVRPDEIYNLAAQSHVKVSFTEPLLTGNTTAMGVTSLLEAVRQSSVPLAKVYQASSSEMFGKSSPPQNEDTPFQPRSPYGAAKVYGHEIAKNYRDAYGMPVTSGILFNHESPRRGETFVTRKISLAVAEIAKGRRSKLYLGNLLAERDWGYAPEYAVAMWRMLQLENPQDLVVATGTSVTVKNFLDWCFESVGLTGDKYVEIDESYLRPTEVDRLLGDPSKAELAIGWKAETFGPKLAELMVRHDLLNLEGEVTDVPASDMWKFETQ